MEAGEVYDIRVLPYNYNSNYYSQYYYLYVTYDTTMQGFFLSFYCFTVQGTECPSSISLYEDIEYTDYITTYVDYGCWYGYYGLYHCQFILIHQKERGMPLSLNLETIGLTYMYVLRGHQCT